MTLTVSAFYKFTPKESDSLAEMKRQLQPLGRTHQLRGLVLLAPEGINGTISGPAESIEWFRRLAQGWFGEISFKDSTVETHPFRRWKIDIRNEIVASATPGLKPPPRNHHLSPQQWKTVLEGKEEFLLVDTRNEYETRIGSFEGAIRPSIESFNEFPEAFEALRVPKEKKILMYCTGGIRCEKAALELQNRGYENVFQLEGGILNYLKHFPHQGFHGECYVFDHRVSVDQNLNASQTFSLCPHCGDPAPHWVECIRCDVKVRICERCQTDRLKGATCSKNCAHHWSLYPGRKGPHQDFPFDCESTPEKESPRP